MAAVAAGQQKESNGHARYQDIPQIVKFHGYILYIIA